LYTIGAPTVSTSGLNFTASWLGPIDTRTGETYVNDISGGLAYTLNIKTATGQPMSLQTAVQSTTFSTEDMSGGFTPGTYYLQVVALADDSSGDYVGVSSPWTTTGFTLETAITTNTVSVQALTTVVQEVLSASTQSPQNITLELLQNQAMTNNGTNTPAATAANAVGVLNNAGGLNTLANITQVANTLKNSPAGTDGALAALLGEVSKTTTLQKGLVDAGLATPGVPVTLGAQAATTLVNSTNLTVSAAIKSSPPTIKVSVPAYDASSISITITDEATLHYAAIAKDVNYTLTIINRIGGGDISETATVLYASATGILTVNGAVIALDSSFSIAGGQFQIQIKGSFGGQFRNGGGGGGGGGASAVCFLGNAPVLTPAGYKRIDSLAAGDMVRTADGRDVAIQRVKHQRILMPSASVNPYVIQKGQFGATENLAISPRHCVAIPGRGMVEARELGLRQMSMRAAFDYYNLELPEWDNMVVAGVEVESLAPKKRVVMSAAHFRGLITAKFGRSVDIAKLTEVARVLADGRVEVSLTQNARRM